MEKNKNIWVIPTDKPSRLIFNKSHQSFCLQKEPEGMYINDGKVSGADFWGIEKANNNGFNPQNIYITNDEEIKKGNWVLFMFDEVTEIVKVNTIVNNAFDSKEGFGYGLEYCKKIIITTDQDLIKDGIQAIDDEFLEWFVKNPTCEEVEVGYGWIRLTETNNEGYWVSIPDNQFEMQQAEPKQEQKQALIDMMKSDEELGLYDDTEINRIELVCKDCSDSLEDCACIKSTIDFPKQEIKLEDVFNDDKKENIKKFIDEIKNPSEPNQALKDAAQRYEKYSERFDNKDNEIVEGIFNPDNWGRRLVKEKPKQETLEEAALLAYPIHLIWDEEERYDCSQELREAFIEGAKWQQENTNINALNFEIDALKREIKALNHQKEQDKNKYGEVEIIEILMEYDYSLVNEGRLNSVGNINKWFKQFKNKRKDEKF